MYFSAFSLPNQYGSVYKLSGRRRNPWCARVTLGTEYDPIKKDYVQKRKSIGCYPTKTKALEALAKYHENPNLMLEGSMTLEALYNSIKDSMKVSENRKQVYDRLFRDYFSPIKDMAVKDIKTKHLQDVIDNCDKKSSTKSNIRALMHKLFEYAVQNDIVAKDYADYITYETDATEIERVVYTEEEIKELWTKKDIDDYAVTLCLIHQGMRLKEFRDMTTEDVDYDAMTINIPQGKNRYSVRTIPINPVILPLLQSLEASTGNGHYTTHNAKSYEYFCNKILHHTAYDVRHTFATKCNQMNLKTVVIQRLMGHKPDNILQDVYTHLTMEELAAEIKKICW